MRSSLVRTGRHAEQQRRPTNRNRSTRFRMPVTADRSDFTGRRLLVSANRLGRQPLCRHFTHARRDVPRRRSDFTRLRLHVTRCCRHLAPFFRHFTRRRTGSTFFRLRVFHIGAARRSIDETFMHIGRGLCITGAPRTFSGRRQRFFGPAAQGVGSSDIDAGPGGGVFGPAVRVLGPGCRVVGRPSHGADRRQRLLGRRRADDGAGRGFLEATSRPFGAALHVSGPPSRFLVHGYKPLGSSDGPIVDT